MQSHTIIKTRAVWVEDTTLHNKYTCKNNILEPFQMHDLKKKDSNKIITLLIFSMLGRWKLINDK